MSLIRPHVRILAEGLDFPEGPAFDSQSRLWFVELKGGNICRLDGEKVVRIPTGGNPSGLAVGAGSRFWFVMPFKIRYARLSPLGDIRDRFAPSGRRTSGPARLISAFDRVGNLLFTCGGIEMGRRMDAVCCLSPDKHVSKIADQLYFPNERSFCLRWL